MNKGAFLNIASSNVDFKCHFYANICLRKKLSKEVPFLIFCLIFCEFQLIFAEQKLKNVM